MPFRDHYIKTSQKLTQMSEKYDNLSIFTRYSFFFTSALAVNVIKDTYVDLLSNKLCLLNCLWCQWICKICFAASEREHWGLLMLNDFLYELVIFLWNSSEVDEFSYVSVKISNLQLISNLLKITILITIFFSIPINFSIIDQIYRATDSHNHPHSNFIFNSIFNYHSLTNELQYSFRLPE